MKKSAWLPAVIAPVVVAGAVAAPVIANAAADPIAGKDPSAAAVLASVASSRDAQYSGQLAQTSDLGLPELPSGSGGSSLEGDASDVLDLLTASHTARVYVDGADRQRFQLTQQLAEQDVVRNGSDVWTWDSKERKAVHVTLPAAPTCRRPAPRRPPTPRSARSPRSRRAPGCPTRRRSASPGTRVAGHADPAVVGHARRHRPARGRPADRTAAARDRDGRRTAGPRVPGRLHEPRLRRTRGPAVRLHAALGCRGQHAGPLGAGRPPRWHGARRRDAPRCRAAVTGSGWDTVVEFPAGTAGRPTADTDATALLDQLTKSVDGGRAVQTSLVSVYLTDDGRVLAGAVPVSALVAAAK